MSYVAMRHQLSNGVEEMMNSADQKDKYDDVIDLSLGDPDLNTSSIIIDKTFEDVHHGYTHYAPALGDPDLILAIQKEYKKSFNCDVKKEEIMVTTSGCHAMWLVLETLLDPEDEVIVFAPYFTPYPEQIRLAQGKVVVVNTLSENHFELDIQDLKNAISDKTKAIIVNTPCNPTGVCMSKEKLEDIAKIAKDYDLLVIADDIYTVYDYAQDFYPICALEDMNNRVITIRSFSKDYCMSGWRIGYVIAPCEIISAMRSVNESNVFVAPIISQRAAYHALSHKEEIGPMIHEVYKKRAEYVYERIKGISYLSLDKPQGSLYVFVDIRKSNETSSSFSKKLFEKYHISVIPGSAFGEIGEGFIRIALREDIPVLKKVFDLLEKDEEWNSIHPSF